MKLMLKLTAKNFFVVSVGLHRFEADVKILGRLDAFVAKNPTHKFVVTGLVAQDNRCRRVPELVAGDADAELFLDRDARWPASALAHFQAEGRVRPQLPELSSTND